MRKSFSILAIVGLVLVTAGVASADFSWQTEPILGSNYSSVTGDVVMITGPTPINPGTGLPYLDVDGNVVLGPTIPHYSIVGDPLYHVGSPSMTQFWINPTAWDGAHWYDPNVFVYSGSGVNLDASASYHYKGVFSFLGTPGNPAYDVVAAEDANFSGSDFIMLNAGVGGFWPEDAGQWTYTETWTDNGLGGASITSSRNFQVSLVPTPAAFCGGLSLFGLLALRRRTH